MNSKIVLHGYESMLEALQISTFDLDKEAMFSAVNYRPSEVKTEF